MSSQSGSGWLNFSGMINSYNTYSEGVTKLISSIGAQTAGAVNMGMLFQLQLVMNLLSMYGQTVTNLIAGVGQVGTSIAKNASG